jgi:hypothetical protein
MAWTQLNVKDQRYLATMILADDLTTATATAANLAMKYGPPIIEMVRDMWHKYQASRSNMKKNSNLAIQDRTG